MSFFLHDKVLFYFHELEKNFIERGENYFLVFKLKDKEELIKIKVVKFPSKKRKLTCARSGYFRAEIYENEMIFNLLEIPDKKSEIFRWLAGCDDYVLMKKNKFKNIELIRVIPWSSEVIESYSILEPRIEKGSFIDFNKSNFSNKNIILNFDFLTSILIIKK